MVFASYVFMFGFLPATLVVYYLLSHVRNALFQRLFLIAASLFFYAYYNVSYLMLILSSIAVNYAIAIGIQGASCKNAKRLLLTLGCVFNVMLLGYFKYYDFFVDTINVVFGTDFVLLNIVLPLGISFFTFQQLSFLVSVYKSEERVEKLRDYILFVVFFPQLIAGPIVLYSEMIPQFKDEQRRRFNSENFAAGLYLFSIGLFKKIVIADTVAVFVSNGFGMGTVGLAASWATALSYTLQIYFDFSGYSDMAMGLGKMFNIDIPQNFNSPYKSESVTAFWRRWHITLGRALSTYVYKPLGGNRRGLPRTCLNLFITFFVSGLWHGANWTFVVWGMLHGSVVVVERIIGGRLEAIPKAIRIGITFLLVNAFWVLFRADDFSQAMVLYAGMVDFAHPMLSQMATIASDGIVVLPAMLAAVYVFGIIAVLLIIVFKCDNSVNMTYRFTPSKRTAVAVVFLLVVSILHLSRESVFIYFNF